MGRRTTAAVTVLAGVLVASTGCDATNGGTATPSSTTDKAAATEALWDPCTQISDEVLRRVGVDPSTRDNTISGVEKVPGWKLCSWHDKPSRWTYNLGVWSSIYTLEEVKGDENNIEFADLSIAGRSGVQFRRADDRDGRVCYIAFPADGQTIEVSVYKAYTTKTPADNRDSCAIAAEAAEVLVPTFPS
ncbi:DUF3558 domain-containing protein [Nocardia amikacinitolerans]|uniref:DUF3558 domain-containing protein n=1 Tax=Nocardia amikacinitolerans TaxID=756689 RepID=UPI0020A31A98|nr:DUF3558 domain-containing protein [Nocardia amikacinitolerans]